MCTGVRFSDKSGNFYFGRNLDWSVGYGEQFVLTPTGYKIPSQMMGDYQVKYPVVGMGIVVDDYPLYFDCANNAGLAIGGLNFAEFGKYADGPKDGALNMCAYELPIWIAGNYTSVEDVKKDLPTFNVIGKAINDNFPVSYLHYIITDKDNCIIVEFMEDGVHIYDNDLGVLTNQPPFNWHYMNVRNYLNVTNTYPDTVSWGKMDLKPFSSGSTMLGFPGGYDPASRFVRAAYLNAHYPDQEGETANIARLFHTLGGCSMVLGGSYMGDGNFEHTVYTSGFSSASNTYYHNTYERFSFNTICMNDYDLASDKLITKQA